MSCCTLVISDLMSETTEGLRNNFTKWNKAIDRNDLKVNHGKQRSMKHYREQAAKK